MKRISGRNDGKLSLFGLVCILILALGNQACETNKTGGAPEVSLPGLEGDLTDTPVLVTQSCQNGIKDGLETDVDCGGGECPQCIPFKACLDDSDCLSSYAPPPGTRKFVGITCTDSVVTGGIPQNWEGKVCMSNEFFAATAALAEAYANQKPGAGTLALGPCHNGVKDGDETDVDCGGSCGDCGAFKACATDDDCQTQVNISGKDYSNIRCTDSVASFDGSQVDLQGNKQCINEGLFWDAVAAAEAQSQAQSGGSNPATFGQVDTSGTGGTGGTGGTAGADSGPGDGDNAGGDPGPGQVSGTDPGTPPLEGSGPFDPSNPGGDPGAGSGSGTGGGGAISIPSGIPSTPFDGVGANLGAEMEACSDGQKNNRETSIDCGGPVCAGCAPFQACVEDRDCLAEVDYNSKSYTDVGCQLVESNKICINADLLADAAAAYQANLQAFFAALPKRHTPEGCVDYQYTFVSNKDGADNVYAVPCNEDGWNLPAVKLTDNTDPNFKYKSIAIHPGGKKAVYGVLDPASAYTLVYDPLLKAGVDEKSFDIGGPGYMALSPSWNPVTEEINFLRLTASNSEHGDPELAWIHPAAVNATATAVGIGPGDRQVGSVNYSLVTEPSHPAYKMWVFSQKSPSGVYQLYADSGTSTTKAIRDPTRGEFKKWEPKEGQEPALSPDGEHLAYIQGGKLYYCNVDLVPYAPPPTEMEGGGEIYRCPGGGSVEGLPEAPASSPCWSSDGKFIYYQLNFLTVNFIKRYELATEEIVTLDEHTGSGAYGGERSPGCFPWVSPNT